MGGTQMRCPFRLSERAAMIGVMQAEGCTSYLEIGCRHGLTFDAVTRSLPVGSRAVGVDLPGALWGSGDSKAELIEVKRKLREDGYDAHVILGDSATAKIIRIAGGLGPYDFGFIDADHNEAAVRSDWLNYSPMCKIVAFHDIAAEMGGDAEEKMAVPKVWAELKLMHRHLEIIETAKDEAAMGTGILWL